MSSPKPPTPEPPDKTPSRPQQTLYAPERIYVQTQTGYMTTRDLVDLARFYARTPEGRAYEQNYQALLASKTPNPRSPSIMQTLYAPAGVQIQIRPGLMTGHDLTNLAKFFGRTSVGKAYERNYEKVLSSERFWESIGYPQYGGKYAPLNIPVGMKVSGITETKSGLEATFSGFYKGETVQYLDSGKWKLGTIADVEMMGTAGGSFQPTYFMQGSPNVGYQASLLREIPLNVPPLSSVFTSKSSEAGSILGLIPSPTAPNPALQKWMSAVTLKAATLTPEQQSKGFYSQIGYPQYGGKYAPFTIPKGYKVESIQQTQSGLDIILGGLPATRPTSITEQVWNWLTGFMSHGTLEQQALSKITGISVKSIQNLNLANAGYPSQAERLSEASIGVGVLGSVESTVLSVGYLGTEAGRLVLGKGISPYTGPSMPETWMSTLPFIGTGKTSKPLGYYVGSFLADIGIGYGIGKASSILGQATKQVETSIFESLPEELRFPMSHGVYELTQAKETITDALPHLPSFRGSTLDKWLYENLPGYAKLTSGLAKGTVTESMRSPLYGAQTIENELLDFATGPGSSLEQIAKTELPAIERMTPSYLAYGTDVFLPEVTRMTPQYESEYKAMPQDYAEGFKKPQGVGLDDVSKWPKMSDLFSNTKAQTSLPQLLKLPVEIGEATLPALVELPSIAKSSMPELFGFSALFGGRQAASRLSMGLDVQPIQREVSRLLDFQASTSKVKASSSSFASFLQDLHANVEQESRQIARAAQNQEIIQTQLTKSLTKTIPPEIERLFNDVSSPIRKSDFLQLPRITRKKADRDLPIPWTRGLKVWPVMTEKEFAKFLYGSGKGKKKNTFF